MLFDRIKGYLEKQQLSLYQDLANAAAEQRKPNMQSLPRPPSREEQLLHEITHVPYAPWCPHCVAMRAVPDRSESLQEAPRDVPSISFDFCYTGYSSERSMSAETENKEDNLCCLIACDSSTPVVHPRWITSYCLGQQKKEKFGMQFFLRFEPGFSALVFHGVSFTHSGCFISGCHVQLQFAPAPSHDSWLMKISKEASSQLRHDILSRAIRHGLL